MRIRELLKEFDVSPAVLKKAFPGDVELIDAIIVNTNETAEAIEAENDLVDKYLEQTNLILEAKKELKETYQEPKASEPDPVLSKTDVLAAWGIGTPTPAAAPVSSILSNWGISAAPVAQMVPVANKEVESLVYDNFHLDTYQKLSALFDLGKGEFLRYRDALPTLEQTNITHKYVLTETGKKMFDLYKNAFVMGTHPFSYVMYTDEDMFPYANFSDGIKDATYGMFYNVPFLLGEDVFIKAPSGFNELKNAYMNGAKILSDFFLVNNPTEAKLIGFDIYGGISETDLGGVVFQVGNTYVKVNIAKYNYVVSKFPDKLNFTGVISDNGKVGRILAKKGDEVIAIFMSDHVWSSIGHELSINDVSSPEDFIARLRLDFPASSMLVKYGDFMKRDKSPIKYFTVESYKREILDLRKKQANTGDKELKAEYEEIISDMKVLAELRFGMVEADDVVRKLETGGEVFRKEVHTGDTLYGNNAVGEEVKVTVLDVRHTGAATWISSKAENGEIIIGDLSAFKERK